MQPPGESSQFRAAAIHAGASPWHRPRARHRTRGRARGGRHRYGTPPHHPLLPARRRSAATPHPYPACVPAAQSPAPSNRAARHRPRHRRHRPVRPDENRPERRHNRHRIAGKEKDSQACCVFYSPLPRLQNPTQNRHTAYSMRFLRCKQRVFPNRQATAFRIKTKPTEVFIAHPWVFTTVSGLRDESRTTQGRRRQLPIVQTRSAHTTRLATRPRRRRFRL